MTQATDQTVTIRTFPLAVAPNGARRSTSDHPALPLDASSIASTAAAVADLGAAILHLHVRDATGGHILDAERYVTTTERIRRETGDRLIVQITTETVGRYGPEEQIAVVKEVRPEAVSLALRELCRGREEEGRFADFLLWLRREHITPQIILYDGHDVSRLNGLVTRGLVPGPPPEALFVLGRHRAGERSDPTDVMLFLEVAQGRYPDFMVCAFGDREAACTAAGVLLGGGARVGFENNLHLPDGMIAPDNAALVCALTGPLGDLGYRPAPVDLIRERMAARFD